MLQYDFNYECTTIVVFASSFLFLLIFIVRKCFYSQVAKMQKMRGLKICVSTLIEFNAERWGGRETQKRLGA